MKFEGRKVIVHNGNIDAALRKLKKKVAEDGIIMELRNRQFYVKPSVQKKIDKAVAKKRWQRQLEKKLDPRARKSP